MLEMFRRKEEPKEKLIIVDLTFDKNRGPTIQEYLMGREDIDILKWRSTGFDNLDIRICIPENSLKPLLDKIINDLGIYIEWYKL